MPEHDFPDRLIFGKQSNKVDMYNLTLSHSIHCYFRWAGMLDSLPTFQYNYKNNEMNKN